MPTCPSGRQKRKDVAGNPSVPSLRALRSELRAISPHSRVALRISPVEMAGGMDVHKNKYIEEWGTARENLEKTFRFTRRNMTLAIIFGIAVPLLAYQGITEEFHKQDAAAEQPRRKFLGSQ